MTAGGDETVAARAVRCAKASLDALGFSDPRTPLPFRLDIQQSTHGAVPIPLASNYGQRYTSAATRVVLSTKAPTVIEALKLLDQGATTTRKLVEEAITVADATTHLGTVVALDQDAVLAEAEVLDVERRAGRLRGPLHGIPITVKDVIDVAGLPTKGGSAAYDDTPKSDAAAVAILREAGALILAKVATHEFALGVATPQCCNPHDQTRISGGSSGGSAIAVATGVGLASIGTDTRASLRVPTALCGVVGFKATFGRIPTEGIIPLSWTVDHVGPITRDASDAALLIDVLTSTPKSCSAIPAIGRPLVVGVVREVQEDCDDDVKDACNSAVGVLEASGCRIVELDTPSVADLELSNDLGLLISRSEAAAYHRSNHTNIELCIPEVRDQLIAALGITAADYLDAQRQRHLLAGKILNAFSHCDVVISPTTPMVAPLRDDYERHLLRLSRNTLIWSLAGCPAASFSCGVGSGGLPVGLQVAGPPGAEHMVVRVGLCLESGLARL